MQNHSKKCYLTNLKRVWIWNGYRWVPVPKAFGEDVLCQIKQKKISLIWRSDRTAEFYM